MNNNLQSLETSALIDLLARHTSDYIRMQSEGTTAQEFEKCKLIIRALQSEIEFRKQTGGNTSFRIPAISFIE